MRVSSATPTSTPVTIAQRSGRLDRRASKAASTAASMTGMNSASETRAVLRITSGGAMAAIPNASIPTRLPQMRAAIKPMRPTASVPSTVWTRRAIAGASRPTTA